MKTSSRKQDRTRYPLPSPIDDASRICVKLFIPNIAGHREAFLGALYNLTRWYAWELDDEKQGRQAAGVWKDIFNTLLDTFYNGCDEEIPCMTFYPDAPFIEWFPNNPYTEPDLVGEGYNNPAWYQATDLSNLILGTKNGDIVTDLSRFPPGSLPSIIPASGLPRFRINLGGPGVVTIHLLNIFAGSVAQITIDDDIGTLRFIDMDRDQIAAPFETATTTPVEIEVEGAGAHHIDVIVVSQLNDQIPFLHHGGGLRKIEVCNGAVEMPYYELRQNPDDPCLIEQRQNPNSEWMEAFRMDNCCGSQTPAQQRLTDTGVIEVSTDGGTTWETIDPAQDPRMNGSLLPPIDTGTDEARCAAANSFVAFMQQKQAETNTQKQAGAGAAALGELVLGFLVAVGVVVTGGALLLLAGALMALVAAADANDWNNSFTSAVWDDLLCLAYCALDSAGQISQAAALQMAAQIQYDHPGDAGNFLRNMIVLQGQVGCTNAARMGLTGTRDCDSCECSDEWWHEFDFTTNAFSTIWHPFAVNQGHYVSGEGYAPDVPIDIAQLVIAANFDSYGGLDLIGYIVEQAGATVTNYNRGVFWNATRDNNDGSLGAIIDVHDRWIGETGGFLNVTFFAPQWVGPAAGGGADVRLTRIVLHGKGINPFGANNYTYDPMNP